MTNPRVVTQENVTIRREAVSPYTEIHWNPVDNTGNVVFRSQWMKYENDQFVGYEQAPTIYDSIEDILQSTITIQTPDGPLEVSGALLMAAIKQRYEDRFVATVNPPTPAEPLQE